MSGYAAPRLDAVRVAVIGLGNRSIVLQHDLSSPCPRGGRLLSETEAFWQSSPDRIATRDSYEGWGHYGCGVGVVGRSHTRQIYHWWNHSRVDSGRG